MSDWVMELNERSKNDHAVIVGSEVRSLVNEIVTLRKALDGVAHAMEEDGSWCWCAYTQMIHPPNDPQDAVPLEANFHTKECNAARAALPMPASSRCSENGHLTYGVDCFHAAAAPTEPCTWAPEIPCPLPLGVNVDCSTDCALPTPSPAEVLNQCDGCCRGLPLREGTHYSPDGTYDLIACTKHLYELQATKPETVDVDGIEDRGIQYWGKATKQPNGKWHAYANINGNLCVVECSITLTTPSPAPTEAEWEECAGVGEDGLCGIHKPGTPGCVSTPQEPTR
jgi:hypothetical protein